MNAFSYDPQKFLFVAGPCSLESEELCHKVVAVLMRLQETHAREATILFKTSFDKANRTNVHSRRGVGLGKGMEILAKIKEQYDLPLTTDIHWPEQAATVSSVCDVIQIPAFLCRQTDLLMAAAQTGRVVNVKKGQFLSPWDAKYIVEKLQHFNAKEIWLTERGTTFGYSNLVVDMRTFAIMQKTQCPLLLDATHSLQMPGSGIGTTGGDRQFVEPLALAALAAGANGIWVETHPNPSEAWSDQATQIPLAELPTLFKKCLKLWKALCTL